MSIAVTSSISKCSFFFSRSRQIANPFTPAPMKQLFNLKQAQSSGNILDAYVTSAPSTQTALDIFKGEWASKLPGELAQMAAGQIPLFEDPRVAWAIEQFGGVAGKSVLELGPLEAGHTYMLEQAGAASITAIEANTRAYLKCLIAKEILQIRRANFLCGDCLEYLRANVHTTQFDSCLASGVLYHMTNPVELLFLMSKVTKQVFIWTHYYDAKILSDRRNFTSKTSSEYAGFKHTLYRQEYRKALRNLNFFGGVQSFSHWMSRDEILACLEYLGFTNLQINFEVPDHPHGPNFAIVASKE